MFVPMNIDRPACGIAYLACVEPECPESLIDRARGRHLEALIDEALVEELLEDPPHGFHEAGVQGLVVILEVDPAAHAPHCRLPLLRVPHHDGSALLIVLVDAHL